jgi:hypothetical protein
MITRGELERKPAVAHFSALCWHLNGVAVPSVPTKVVSEYVPNMAMGRTIRVS